MYIQVQTAQYVPIEYEAATAGERIVAFLLDLALQFAYVYLTSYFFFTADLYGATWYLPFVLGPFVCYPLACEALFNGQTPGKSVMKIRVVKLDGSSPGFTSFFMRWILGWFENWLLFGIPSLIATASNARGQRLGDMAAGTAVIRLKFKVRFEHTLFRDSDDDYRPHYPFADRLSDKDVAIINELLRSNEGAAKERLLEKAARRVESLLGITAQEPLPREFLSRLIRDYNHLAGKNHD